jgi:hypothetical protein
MAKHTIESLMENGWVGIAKHKITGNERKSCCVLDSIAWVANNKPYLLKIQIDNNVARVWIENDAWIPESPDYKYMVKDFPKEIKKDITIKELLE